jgi:hypothetical protein
MVAHACKPSYSGGRDLEDHSWRTAQAKSSQDPISSNKKLGIVVHACHSSYSGNGNRRLVVQAGLDQNTRVCLKIMKAEEAGCMGQVVACLASTRH